MRGKCVRFNVMGAGAGGCGTSAADRAEIRVTALGVGHSDPLCGG
jgi:hypothetical protein